MFRADGMQNFSDSTQGFLNSFAPLLAMALVGGFLVAAGGHPTLAMESVGSTVVAMLAQPVVSHWFAVRWDREGPWLRYATAVNWCQWAPMLAIFMLMPLVQIATDLGLAPQLATLGLLAAAFTYALALSWFLARVGLGVSRLRALILMIAVHVVLVVVVEGPLLLSGR
ncbi:MAG: hypothetical protein KGK10_06005 [Rhodospirillales bacterium]|nr:hypothetical protein [Rhodospirillales bacterium]